MYSSDNGPVSFETCSLVFLKIFWCIEWQLCVFVY